MMPPRPSSLQAFLSAPLTWEDILFLVLMIAVVGTRLVRLSTIPAVYPDEANYIEIAHNLIHGRFEWGVFTHTFIPRLPLPLAAMGVASEILGANLTAIRLTCALSECFAALIAYLVAVGGANRKHLGLWTLLVLCAHPFVVCYSRWGFTYNFLPLFSMLSLFFGSRLSSPGHAGKYEAGLVLSVAGGLLCEPMAIALLLYGIVLLAGKGPRKLFLFIAFSTGPLCLYLLFLWLSQGSLLASDLQGIFSTRLQGNAEGSEPAVAVLVTSLWRAHGWSLWGGLLGMVALPPVLRRHALLQCFLWMGIMALLAPDDYTLLVRQSIVLFPFAAFGWGAIALRFFRLLSVVFHEDLTILVRGVFGFLDWSKGPSRPPRWVRPLSLAAVWVLEAAVIYWLLIQPARFLLQPRLFTTPLHAFCVDENATLDEAARFIAQNVQDTDLVLGDHVPRPLPCRKSTLMQMAVVEGARGHPFFPQEVFRDRRAGPWRFRDVKYVLLSPYNFEVETLFPGVGDLLAEVEKWPVVFKKNAITIHLNPSKDSVSRPRWKWTS